MINSKATMITTGILTSVWDGKSAKFDTKAIMNDETGEVESLETIDGDELEGLSCLTDEYFTTSGGNKIPVCTQCHQYVLVNDRCKGGCDD
jgi:hypothetical protein